MFTFTYITNNCIFNYLSLWERARKAVGHSSMAVMNILSPDILKIILLCLTTQRSEKHYEQLLIKGHDQSYINMKEV